MGASRERANPRGYKSDGVDYDPDSDEEVTRIQGSPADGQVGGNAYRIRDFEADRDRMLDDREAAGLRQAQLMESARADSSRQDVQRAQQMGLIASLENQRRGGTGPSQAGIIGQMAADRGMRQAATQMGQGQGLNAALATQGAGQELATQQASGIAMMDGRQLEKQQINLMNQGMKQDMGVATAQGGRDQQANIKNLEAKLRQQKMNDDLVMYYTQQGYDLEVAQSLALIESERQAASLYQTEVNANSAISKEEGRQEAAGDAADDAEKGTVGSLLFSLSDKRLKKNIKKESKDLDEFMSTLKSYSYDYKNQKHGEGKRYGIMAQDMEKSALGSEIVREVKEGKAIDVNKGLSASLAGLARLNERLSKIEGDK